MRLATRADRDRVVEIMYRAYEDNPSFLWIIKKSSPEMFKKRLKWLSEFCFDLIQPIDGVYITSRNDGMCMVYNNLNKKNSAYTWWLQLKLAVRVIGISRALEILKRESYIKKHRPGGSYLYFWVLAVDPAVRGFRDMQEIRDEVYQMADDNNLSIYAETTVEKNRVMYLRYGFREYHQWEVPGKNVTIYFMKREPNTIEERNKQ